MRDTSPPWLILESLRLEPSLWPRPGPHRAHPVPGLSPAVGQAHLLESVSVPAGCCWGAEARETREGSEDVAFSNTLQSPSSPGSRGDRALPQSMGHPGTSTLLLLTHRAGLPHTPGSSATCLFSPLPSLWPPDCLCFALGITPCSLGLHSRFLFSSLSFSLSPCLSLCAGFSGSPVSLYSTLSGQPLGGTLRGPRRA